MCNGGTPDLTAVKLGRGEVLDVRGYPGPCTMRRRYVRIGRDSTRYSDTHVNCRHNLLRSVVERVFCVKGEDGTLRRPHRPTIPEFRNTVGTFATVLRNLLPPTAPMKKEAVPFMYVGRRRKTYQNAVDSLRSRPVERSDSRMSSFGKAETTDFSHKLDAVMRLIQPRHPRYNVEVARFLKPLEHLIYTTVSAAEMGWMRDTETPIIVKCLDPYRRAEVIVEKCHSFKDWVCIGMDASRFDQHVSVAALDWEHSIYTGPFEGHPEIDMLKKLLSWQLVNTGYARSRDEGTIKYTVHGCRMSGDMNTALGNCLIMTGICFGLQQATGIKFEVVNDGDDCLIICERRDAQRLIDAIPGHFRQAGFKMVVEPLVDVIEQIEFCQSHPVWNGERWVMCRNIAKALANDASGFGKWTDPRTQAYMLGAVGQCGGHLCVGLPLMQDFYEAMRKAGKFRRLYEDCLTTGFGRMAHMASKTTGLKLTAEPPMRPITDESRLSFARAFGLYPSMQCLLEGQWSFAEGDTPNRILSGADECRASIPYSNHGRHMQPFLDTPI